MAIKEPFRIHILRHYHIVSQDLPKKPLKILDFGSGNGEFIGKLSYPKWQKFGAEVDKGRLTEAKKNYKGVNFKQFGVGERLPFADNYFDVVTMFHVLEHVDSEQRALKEVYRVLKKGGTFYLASPYNGLFTWADTANLRYRFPKLHKLFGPLILGKKEYNSRFAPDREDQLYGDCSNSRTWHKHYTQAEIKKLLGKKFEIMNFMRFSVFHPFLLVILNIGHFIFKRHLGIFVYLVYLDNQINAGQFSYNMLVVSKKK